MNFWDERKSWTNVSEESERVVLCNYAKTRIVEGLFLLSGLIRKRERERERNGEREGEKWRERGRLFLISFLSIDSVLIWNGTWKSIFVFRADFSIEETTEKTSLSIQNFCINLSLSLFVLSSLNDKNPGFLFDFCETIKIKRKRKESQ